MIYQIVYTSQATPRFSENTLEVMLEKGRANNNLREVTGILLYSGGYFIQLLEGEELVVKKLLNKISYDERHTEIQVIFEQTTENRLFGNWSMAYASLTDEMVKTYGGTMEAKDARQLIKLLQRPNNVVAEMLRGMLTDLTKGIGNQ